MHRRSFPLSPSPLTPRTPSPIFSIALHLLTEAKDSHKYIQQATSCSTPHYFLCAMKVSLSWFYTTYLIIIYLFSISFFTLCKISSHYTRSLITECRPGLGQRLQYRLTHCKDHCWLLLNPEPFTTTARRQASMRWHYPNICLLLSAQSAQPWWELPSYDMLERVLTGCLLIKSIPRQGRCQTVVAQT